MAVNELSQLEDGDIAVGPGSLAGFRAPALRRANGEPQRAPRSSAATMPSPEFDDRPLDGEPEEEAAGAAEPAESAPARSGTLTVLAAIPGRPIDLRSIDIDTASFALSGIHLVAMPTVGPPMMVRQFVGAANSVNPPLLRFAHGYQISARSLFRWLRSGGSGWRRAGAGGEPKAVETQDHPAPAEDAGPAAHGGRPDAAAPAEVEILANEMEIEGDRLTVVAASNGAHGTVTLNLDGSVDYLPDDGYEGPDTFTYTVADEFGRKALGMAMIVVRRPGLEAPEEAEELDALEKTGGSAETEPRARARDLVDALDKKRPEKPQAPAVPEPDEEPDAGDPTSVIVDVLSHHHLVDPHPTVALRNWPAHGRASVNEDGTITYTPSQGYVGADKFTYVLTESDGRTASGTVTLKVDPLPEGEAAE